MPEALALKFTVQGARQLVLSAEAVKLDGAVTAGVTLPPPLLLPDVELVLEVLLVEL